MANYNKQIEKWMSKASFNGLDLSTIPEGTEINIVGDIEESDLSLELLNKINNAGGHLWKLTYDGKSGWGLITCYINTNANTIEDLASDIMNRPSFIGTFYASTEQWGFESIGLHVFKATSISAIDNTLNMTLYSYMAYVMGEQTFSLYGFPSTGPATPFTVEKLY